MFCISQKSLPHNHNLFSDGATLNIEHAHVASWLLLFLFEILLVFISCILF
jgi:hypothetical protein